MREFSVSFGGLTLAGAPINTCVFVNPPAAPGVNIEFLRYWLGQAANATSAQQRVQLSNQASVFPTLTGATPTKMKLQDAVSAIVSGTAGAAGTAGVNASAEGAGTKTVLWDDAFNVLNGWLYLPGPQETRILNAGLAAGHGLITPVAPATNTGWSGGLVFREV